MTRYDYTRDFLPILQAASNGEKEITVAECYALFERSSNPVIRRCMPSMRTNKTRACGWVDDRLRYMRENGLIVKVSPGRYIA